MVAGRRNVHMCEQEKGGEERGRKSLEECKFIACGGQKQMSSRGGRKLGDSRNDPLSFRDQPRARHLHLSCPAERKSFTPAGRERCMPYAACSVVGVERVLARRFCSINGSSTSPQLMHRKTVPSVAYSGRDSTIIKPLHFLQVIRAPPAGVCLCPTSANVAMED